jgi:hypothetical protein
MSDLFLNDEETKILYWIHSNKFITTKLFHLKFMPNNTFRGACKAMERLVDKNLLKRSQAHIHADSFYTLHRATIRRLKEAGVILTAPEIRAPHMNVFEKEHDKRVVEMRIHIERSPGLEYLCWLTDYEMRIGLHFDWKKLLDTGRGHELKGTRLQKSLKRVPDGYFEAEIKGKLRRFILEYEHSPYSNERINSMIQRVYGHFPNAIKLVVTKDQARLFTLREKLAERITDPLERASWVFSSYNKVTSLPFLKVPWLDLDRYYLAFLDEDAAPVLNQANPPPHPGPSAQGREDRTDRVLNLELPHTGGMQREPV